MISMAFPADSKTATICFCHCDSLLPPSKGVLAGPWSAWMPEHITAFEGTCVVIPCRFSYPEELRPPTIHGIWYFNSPYPKNYPPVVYKSRTNIVHESYVGRSRLLGELNFRNCTLQISRLSPELSGKYYFRGDLGGYNQYTYPEHSNLEVINKPTIVNPPEVVEGSDAELRCEVPDNCPDMKPVITWMNYENLAEHSVYAQIEEEDPPRILQVNSSVEVLHGAHVFLMCIVDSSPTAMISWLREDEILHEDLAGNLTLYLDNVTHLQDGLYTCVAENIYGKDNHSLALSVLYAPWKPVVNGSLMAVEGEPVTISCSSQSSPDPTITIFKDKKPLAMGVYKSQVEMEFESVSHEDDGEYWCTAENQFGQSSTAFNLTVESARDTVKCICAAKANPEAMITFELPTRNVTVNETDREFVYSQKTGYIVTSILTVQREVDSQLYIVCSARNLYGTKNQQLQKNNENPGFGQTENPPVVYSGDYRTPGNLEKSEYGRCDKRLLNKREDLGIDYANIDFTKLSTKDSYTLTEELAEYAEIRVK
ncbi:hypothetical protein E2320_000579 [Naja naja]|nr:hypothetical protein E2320_000579 [Naja naja]